jgi:AraC-like DNA-binding protein
MEWPGRSGAIANPVVSENSIAEVARAGYESPAAFSKALKRIMRVGPRQFRRSATTTTDAHDALI